MALATREGEPFLTLNGTQTQSAKIYNLLLELPRLIDMNIAVARISPQAEHTGDIIHLFRRCLEGTLTPQVSSAIITGFVHPSGQYPGAPPPP